jgi:2-C-methyl-D-erythritol 2,4-cyclodiphosphate synthase
MLRCGTGYDVHRLAPGRKLILGGIEIPSERGLEGHSDADVLCHAIADALLGAVGEGDIGHHFPNTDESIRGISSLEILRKVTSVLNRRDAHPVNVDATLIAEAPKVAPHIPAMRAKIAGVLNLETSRVSIKATTNEGLGAIGRGEGMAAMAVATVETTD